MRIACAACALLAACGFHTGSPIGDGGGDDDDGLSITDSTFAMGTFTAGDAYISDDGIEPDALFPDGLHALSYTGASFTTSSTWDQILASAAAGQKRGEGLTVAPTNYDTDLDPTDVPNGLGLGTTSTDAFLLVMDGELKLGTGNRKLSSVCDDECFVQVAKTPGPVTANTEFFDPVFSDASLHPIDIPSDGWYAIRFAFADYGGGAHWAFSVDGSPVSPTNLRVRGRALTGLVATAFAHPGFVRAKPIQPLNAIDADVGPGPYDLDGEPSTPSTYPMYSLRWTGQLRAATEISQTVFRMDTGQGGGTPVDPYRIWIDHQIIADTIGAGPALSAPITITAGPHDVMVDVSVRQSPPPQVKLLWSSLTFSETTIPHALLHPALSELTASYDLKTGENAAGPTQITPMFQPPSGTVADVIDFGIGTQVAALPSGSTASVTACGANATWTLVPAPPSSWSFFGGVACNGMPAGNVSATLTPASNTQIYPFAAEAYRGGTAPAPYETSFTYVSAPFATPDAGAFGTVHVDGYLDGATVAIGVRTAADSGSLDAASWTMVDNDATPALTAQAYVQYQLVVTTDGWHDPIISKVTLTFATK